MKAIGAITAVRARSIDPFCAARRFVVLGFFVLAFLILPATAKNKHTPSGPAGSAPVSIWVITHRALQALGEPSAFVPLPREASAAAIDPMDDGVWVLAHKNLYKFDRFTSLILELDLKPLAKGLDDPEHLVVDPYDASLWIASKKVLLHLDKNGHKVAEWRAPDDIEAIALAFDQSPWLLTKKQLLQLSPVATVLHSVDLSAHVKNPRHLALDSLRTRLTVASDRDAVQFNIADLAADPQPMSLPARRNDGDATIQALVVDPLDGVLWVVRRTELLRYDALANFRGHIDLQEQGLPKLEAAAFEPKSRSLWLAGHKLVLQIANDSVVSKISFRDEIEGFGVMSPAVSPTAALLEPLDGVVTNNPTPAFRVQLGALCNGGPCDVGFSYVEAFVVKLLLNQAVATSAFAIANNIASHVPSERLQEGQNEFSIGVTDVFGRAAQRIEGRITIDTVAPHFLSVTPAHNAVVTTAEVTIQGQTDDPSATVGLQSPSGPTLTAPNPLNFSFNVALAPGANEFTLIARDPPGNIATFPLTLIYNPASGASVAQPLPGSTVAGNSVTVSGTFSGAPNTGVTVNGVIATTFGNEFLANNVPLQAGGNTITVVANTIDGEVGRQEFAITAAGDSRIGVERVTPRTAIIDTIAGTGARGFGGDNGPATAALLHFPWDLMIGVDNSVYVADAGNRRIRRIGADGTITMIAGTGAVGHGGDGGLATAASFEWVGDLVIAPDGRIYVNDNTRIRLIDPFGVIRTIAGSSFGFSGDGGPAISARFGGFLGLALADDGSIYVADADNSRIRKIDPSGIVNTIAGSDAGYSGDGGPVAEAQFDAPVAIALGPGGTIYVADAFNSVVRRIGADGIVTTVAGDGTYGNGGDGGPATAAQLGWPGDLALDSQRNLYISDYDNANIRRVDPHGIITTVAGTGVSGYSGDGGPPLEAQLGGPAGIAIASDGTLHVVDSDNHRIRAFNAFLPAGELLPFGVAFRIINNTGNRVQAIAADYDGDGAIDATASSESTPLQFRYPGPGIYTAKFTVTDETGAVYTVSYVVVVTDVATSDAMLRGAYRTMLDRLRVGNIEGALNAITGGMRAKYQNVFNALQADLAVVVDRLGTLEAGAIGEEIAEYVLVRNLPDGTRRAFLIYFLRSEDGVWRIDGM